MGDIGYLRGPEDILIILARYRNMVRLIFVHETLNYDFKFQIIPMTRVNCTDYPSLGFAAFLAAKC